MGHRVGLFAFDNTLTLRDSTSMAAKKLRTLVVAKKVFSKNPMRYLRKASPNRRVVVKDVRGKVSLDVGGSLEAELTQ
jgi:hypothetical protein